MPRGTELRGRSRRFGLLPAYYLATPVFALLDLGLGASVRVSALSAPVHRVAYYVSVFALGFLCRARPGVAPWVGMLESSVNLFLLLLAILLPIWSLPDAFASGAPMEAGLTGASATNALLSGCVLVLAFHRNREAAGRRLGREGLGRFL